MIEFRPQSKLPIDVYHKMVNRVYLLKQCRWVRLIMPIQRGVRDDP